jgi:hypothetical protein
MINPHSAKINPINTLSNKKIFEVDPSKWEGTGLEDEFKQVYQNPEERKKAAKIKDK